MDGAWLVIAVNEACPQPQTREHLEALKISETKNIVIAQNKVELRSIEDVTTQYNDIKEFIQGSFAEEAPIMIENDKSAWCLNPLTDLDEEE